MFFKYVYAKQRRDREMLRISTNLQIAAVNAMGVPPGRPKEGLVIWEEVGDRDDRIQKKHIWRVNRFCQHHVAYNECFYEASMQIGRSGSLCFQSVLFLTTKGDFIIGACPLYWNVCPFVAFLGRRFFHLFIIQIVNRREANAFLKWFFFFRCKINSNRTFLFKSILSTI